MSFNKRWRRGSSDFNWPWVSYLHACKASPGPFRRRLIWAGRFFWTYQNGGGEVDPCCSEAHGNLGWPQRWPYSLHSKKSPGPSPWLVGKVTLSLSLSLALCSVLCYFAWNFGTNYIAIFHNVIVDCLTFWYHLCGWQRLAKSRVVSRLKGPLLSMIWVFFSWSLNWINLQISVIL